MNNKRERILNSRILGLKIDHLISLIVLILFFGYLFSDLYFKRKNIRENSRFVVGRVTSNVKYSGYFYKYVEFEFVYNSKTYNCRSFGTFDESLLPKKGNLSLVIFNTKTPRLSTVVLNYTLEGQDYGYFLDINLDSIAFPLMNIPKYEE